MITCQNCHELNYDDMTYCFACRQPMYPQVVHHEALERNEKDAGCVRKAKEVAHCQREQGRQAQCLTVADDKESDRTYDAVSRNLSVESAQCTSIQQGVVRVKPYKNQAYGYLPTKTSVLVGNSAVSDIVLPELTRGKEVARIYLEKTYVLVEQMDAQTTLVIAGEPATGITHARVGEPIYIAKSSLVYEHMNAA